VAPPLKSVDNTPVLPRVPGVPKVQPFFKTMDDESLKLLYQKAPVHLLQDFEKLSPSDQAKFNAMIKKWKIGPELVAEPQQINKLTMTSKQVTKLEQQWQLYYDQQQRLRKFMKNQA
jgi:hypothetical protein